MITQQAKEKNMLRASKKITFLFKKCIPELLRIYFLSFICKMFLVCLATLVGL